jgi:hypothetical protein
MLFKRVNDCLSDFEGVRNYKDKITVRRRGIRGTELNIAVTNGISRGPLALCHLHCMADATSHNVTLRWEKSRELNSDFCRHSTRDSVSALGFCVSNPTCLKISIRLRTSVKIFHSVRYVSILVCVHL